MSQLLCQDAEMGPIVQSEHNNATSETIYPHRKAGSNPAFDIQRTALSYDTKMMCENFPEKVFITGVAVYTLVGIHQYENFCDILRF